MSLLKIFAESQIFAESLPVFARKPQYIKDYNVHSHVW